MPIYVGEQTSGPFTPARNILISSQPTTCPAAHDCNSVNIYFQVLRHVQRVFFSELACFRYPGLRAIVSGFPHFPLAQQLFVYEIIRDPIGSGGSVVSLIFRSVYCTADARRRDAVPQRRREEQDEAGAKSNSSELNFAKASSEYSPWSNIHRNSGIRAHWRKIYFAFGIKVDRG